ncbi:MAG: PSD1 and planctomycete cytochrome C domain-containing protein [Opitutus sp.]
MLPLRFAVLAIIAATPLVAAPAAPNFSREILPILSDNCFACHGPDAGHRKAKLRLDEEAEAKREHSSGITVVPGKSDESELFYRITATDPEEVMPPPDSHKTLTAAQREVIGRWIDSGAKWGVHWSLSALTRPETPSTREPGAINPIDGFVRAKLRAEKLVPAREASRETLIRRVTLDLTGLPPTRAEVAAYLADLKPGAYERVVDRLLASPAYGERMAWDWMEVARYADTNGYQGDNERTMYPWRDWVVKAFNENMPYDQFTIWQLAGDQLPDSTVEQKIATAFLRNHPINGEGGRIPEENRVEYVLDMTETTGTAWLGLTVGCARCHDHKFDPISQRDYYSLSAFFNQTAVDGSGGSPQTKPVIDLTTLEERDHLAKLEAALVAPRNDLDALETQIFPREAGLPASKSPAAAKYNTETLKALDLSASKRNAGQLEWIAKYVGGDFPEYTKAATALSEQLKQRDVYQTNLVRVMIMEDQPTPRKTFVLSRGLYSQPLDEVTAATPGKLPPLPPDVPHNRLALARWLMSTENPLTARVSANRIWQLFFGVGLVKTAGDFGVQGEFPKQPELLDWLATDFRDSGWDVKLLVRTIVTSATYRQDSRLAPELMERDPENRLLARGPRFRLPSWALRDQALAASGLLVNRPGGPAVKPYQPPGIWEEATFGKTKYEPDHGDALYRRSLYIFWRRISAPTMFFDTAARTVCTVKPSRTNTPLHALATLNDTTYVEAARVLADHALTADSADQRRLDFVFQQVLARKPESAEANVLLGGLKRQRAHFAAAPSTATQLLSVGESKSNSALKPIEHAAWTALCLAVLNLDETLNKP